MMAATLHTPAPKNNKEAMSTMQMLSLVGEIGYLIAIPAVLFAFGGAYLDRMLDTSPLFLIAGLALALLSSALAVWHRVKPLLDSVAAAPSLEENNRSNS